jgi:hypothetical protein
VLFHGPKKNIAPNRPKSSLFHDRRASLAEGTKKARLREASRLGPAMGWGAHALAAVGLEDRPTLRMLPTTDRFRYLELEIWFPIVAVVLPVF